MIAGFKVRLAPSPSSSFTRNTHTHTRTRSQKSNFQPCQFLSQQLPSLDAFPACQGSFSQPKERVTWLWGRSLSPNFPGPSGCDLRCCATGAAAGPQGASKARGCPAAGAWHRFSPLRQNQGILLGAGRGGNSRQAQAEGGHPSCRENVHGSCGEPKPRCACFAENKAHSYDSLSLTKPFADT